MKKVKKMYLPKWQRWFIVPIIIGVWIMATYQEFFSETAKKDMGTLGYVIFSIIIFGAGTITFLMASGKLPAYVSEEEVTGEENQ